MIQSTTWSVDIVDMSHHVLSNRDLRNRFFYFGTVSVRFGKKTQILFGMSLVLFG